MRILHRLHRTLWVWSALAAAMFFSPPLAGAELTEAEFQRLQKELTPPADEPWRTIPWKIGLLDAQQAAVQQQKPIFIWAMDGHPLGCT